MRRKDVLVAPAAPTPASARAQRDAFLAVRVGEWHICPRCLIEPVAGHQPFCVPCVSELRRITRLTAHGGDAYENEQSEGEG